MRRALALGGLVLAGCRTEIAPIVKRAEPAAEVSVRKAGCDVHDYENATEVPAGARELGPVEVPREATDEETYQKLRQAICERGGDALSGLAWVKEPGQPQPTALKANAWSLP